MKKRKLPFSFKDDDDDESNFLPKQSDEIRKKFSPHNFYKTLRKDIISQKVKLPYHLLDVERFIILDVETTGFSREMDDIVEIAAVEVEERRITGVQFHSYIHSTKVGLYDSRVHGLSNEFLAGQPKIQFVLRQFYRFLEGSGDNLLKKTVVVSHNRSFDVGFLNTKMKNHDDDKGDYPIDGIECESVCSMILFKKMYERHRYDLDSCCHFFGIDCNGPRKYRHGALIDTLLLGKFFLCLLDVLEEVKKRRKVEDGEKEADVEEEEDNTVGRKRKSEVSQHRKDIDVHKGEGKKTDSLQPPQKKRKI